MIVRSCLHEVVKRDRRESTCEGIGSLYKIYNMGMYEFFYQPRIPDKVGERFGKKGK